jgi:hypothetical protein
MPIHNSHIILQKNHESSFGLYYGDGVLPDPSNANAELIQLFTEKLP